MRPSSGPPSEIASIVSSHSVTPLSYVGVTVTFPDAWKALVSPS